MWHSYFYQIQNKYNMRVSTNTPLIIRLDGKNVTKSRKYDLMDDYDGGFLDVLTKTVRYFTYKYECLALFGSDEISFIFENPMVVIEDLDKDKVNRTNEIISLFSQYFFDYFNTLNNNDKIFWHGKCFSISKEKVKSYIKYRSRIIKNVMTTYFLRKKNIFMGNYKMDKKEIECSKFEDYHVLEKIQNGILYYKGEQINLEEFYNNNIILKEKNVNKNIKSENLMLDLNKF